MQTSTFSQYPNVHSSEQSSLALLTLQNHRFFEMWEDENKMRLLENIHDPEWENQRKIGK